ncbi:MAG: hypothetical protein AB7O24_26070 [Kofleriaceae bacterium]
MANNDKLPSIDLDSLDQVTGGVSRPAASSSDDSGGDAQITALLQGINDALKQLGENNNSKSSFRDLMPFFLLLTDDWNGRNRR